MQSDEATDDTVAELYSVKTDVSFSKPSIPLIFAVGETSEVSKQRNSITREMSTSLESLCARDKILKLLEGDRTTFFEIGSYIAGSDNALMYQGAEAVLSFTTSGSDAPRALLQVVAGGWVRGIPVDWGVGFGKRCTVALPTYAFQRERYWLGTGNVEEPVGARH